MRRLPRKLLGTSSTEVWLNQLRDGVEERTPQRTIGALLHRGLRGFTSTPKVSEEISGDSGSNVSLYRISAISGDYLTCYEVTHDPVTLAVTLATTSTKIAKPYYLRITPFITASVTFPNNDGNTRRTTGTFQGVANVHLDEFMTPAYAVGDEIMGADVGQTGIIGATVQDTNDDAREWKFAKQFVELCVLIGGVPTTKHMQIYGSAVF